MILLPEQLTLWPGDEQKPPGVDKRLHVLKRLEIAPFIPHEVFARYYQDTGRPPYPLESMLLALLAQELFKIPTTELLITVLRISPLLCRCCGFHKSIPDESTFRRFKQRLGPGVAEQLLDKACQEAHRLLEQELSVPPLPAAVRFRRFHQEREKGAVGVQPQITYIMGTREEG